MDLVFRRGVPDGKSQPGLQRRGNPRVLEEAADRVWGSGCDVGVFCGLVWTPDAGTSTRFVPRRGASSWSRPADGVGDLSLGLSDRDAANGGGDYRHRASEQAAAMAVDHTGDSFYQRDAA